MSSISVRQDQILNLKLTPVNVTLNEESLN